MTWAKATNIATAEVHWDSTPEALDPSVYTIELLDGEPVEPLQAEKWEAVKAVRAAKLLLAPTPFGTAQADTESKENISGLVQMATIAKSAGAPFSEVFTMADNSEVEMSADQMIGFGVAVGRHISAIHARGRELRAAIYAEGVTAEDLAALDITTGWP
jgi:hypothetical protein